MLFTLEGLNPAPAMRRKLLLLALAQFFLPLRNLAQGYTFLQSTAPYTHLQSATVVDIGEPWEGIDAELPIGFNFRMYDDLGSAIYLGGGRAWLQRDQLLECFDPNGSPIISLNATSVLTSFSTEEDVFIDRGWPDNALTVVSYTLEGASGDRIFKVELENLGFFAEWEQSGTTNSHVSMQYWLHESDCAIEIRFGEVDVLDPGSIYGGNTGGMFGPAHFICPFVSDASTWLSGDASAATPVDGVAQAFVTGTPPPGAVYRFVRNGGCALQLAVAEVERHRGLEVLPNPSSGMVHVDLGDPGDGRMLRVYGPTGALLDEAVLGNAAAQEYRLPDAPGIYVLQVIGTDGATRRTRVVRE